MKRIGWIAFAALQIAAWVVYRTAWMTTWWNTAQLWIGIASLGVAFFLLMRGVRPKILIVALLVGLLVGQWHLWSGWLAQAIWRYRGFAP